MSLIGDALRKARQEAADRESDRKGVLFSARISDSPARSNLGLGLALGAVIAVAATVAGGSAVWWLLKPGETTQTGTISTPPAAATAVVEAAEMPGGSLPPTAAKSGSPSQAPPAAEGPPPSSTETNQTGLKSDQPAAPLTIAVETKATAGSDEANFEGGFTGIEDGAEVYVLEADLGAVHLGLDYIIYRAEDPFVEINGVELHLGGVIDGYRVKAIERDRVHLSNGVKNIVLRAP